MNFRSPAPPMPIYFRFPQRRIGEFRSLAPQLGTSCALLISHALILWASLAKQGMRTVKIPQLFL